MARRRVEDSLAIEVATIWLSVLFIIMPTQTFPTLKDANCFLICYNYNLLSRLLSALSFSLFSIINEVLI